MAGKKNPHANGTVSLPVRIEKREVDHHRPWPASVELLPLNGSSTSIFTGVGQTVASAKTEVVAALREALVVSIKREQNSRKAAIGTGSGTVFLVRFDQSWGYDLVGPGRSHAAGCCLPACRSFDETWIAARRHATDMGGIVWETSC